METQTKSAKNHKRSWWKIIFHRRIIFLSLVALSLVFVGIVNSGNYGRALLFAALNYSSEISRLASHGKSWTPRRAQRQVDTSSIVNTMSLPAANTAPRFDRSFTNFGSGALDTSTPKPLPVATPTRRLDKTLADSDLGAVAKGSPLWQRLDNESDVFLYSAHYDDVETPDDVVVRLVGIARYPLPYSDVWCRFFDGDGRVTASNVSGKLYHVRDNNGLRYIGAFADCPVTNDTRPPYSIAVGKHRAPLHTFYMVHYSQDPISRATLDATSGIQTPRTHHNEATTNHALNVNDRTRNSSVNPATSETVSWSKLMGASSSDGGRKDSAVFRWNITRCFPAFFGRPARQHEHVAEMVAASRALGVDHFQFYVQSASPQLLKLLKVLTESGVAEVLTWNLRMSGGEVHYLGQFSAIQDCLYRHLHSSRYLLFGDVDELFVPRTHDSLLTLLDHLFSKNPHCGAFLFRNTVFSFMFSTKIPPTDPQSVRFIQKHDFPLLTHITRNKVVHNPGDRSKPAVDPRKVSVGGVHVVHKLRPGFQQCTVDPSAGLLQHYRHFKYGNARDTETTEDPYIWRLTDTILKETQELLRTINMTLPVH